MIILELQKIALIGTYLSFLWFIPVLYIFKRPLEWKIRKIRLFSFVPTIGAFVFVVGITVKLFIDKNFISFDLNHFNVLIILFLLLQTFVTLIMEVSLNSFKSKSENIDLKSVKKLEYYYCLGFTILFAFDMLVRFEIYRLTF